MIDSCLKRIVTESGGSYPSSEFSQMFSRSDKEIAEWQCTNKFIDARNDAIYKAGGKTSIGDFPVSLLEYGWGRR